MKLVKPILLSALPALAVLGSTQAAAVPVTLTIENLSQNESLFLTPVWTAFHDGSFDLYNTGEAVGSGGLPAGLESLAEDGNTAALSGDFAGSSAAARGGFDATNPGANGVPVPVAPGEVLTDVFDLDSDLNRFFSYGSLANPDCSPVNILGRTNAAGLDIDSFAADFTRAGYELARFSFSVDDDNDGGNGGAEEVPAPASLALLFAGLAGMI